MDDLEFEQGFDKDTARETPNKAPRQVRCPRGGDSESVNAWTTFRWTRREGGAAEADAAEDNVADPLLTRLATTRRPRRSCAVAAAAAAAPEAATGVGAPPATPPVAAALEAVTVGVVAARRTRAQAHLERAEAERRAREEPFSKIIRPGLACSGHGFRNLGRCQCALCTVDNTVTVGRCLGWPSRVTAAGSRSIRNTSRIFTVVIRGPLGAEDGGSWIALTSPRHTPW